SWLRCELVDAYVRIKERISSLDPAVENSHLMVTRRGRYLARGRSPELPGPGRIIPHHVEIPHSRHGTHDSQCIELCHARRIGRRDRNREKGQLVVTHASNELHVHFTVKAPHQPDELLKHLVSKEAAIMPREAQRIQYCFPSDEFPVTGIGVRPAQHHVDRRQSYGIELPDLVPNASRVSLRVVINQSREL